MGCIFGSIIIICLGKSEETKENLFSTKEKKNALAHHNFVVIENNKCS